MQDLSTYVQERRFLTDRSWRRLSPILEELSRSIVALQEEQERRISLVEQRVDSAFGEVESELGRGALL